MINRYIEMKNFCKKNSIIIVDNIDTGAGKAFNNCRDLVVLVCGNRDFGGPIIR
jgi:hypothetical protein